MTSKKQLLHHITLDALVSGMSAFALEFEPGNIILYAGVIVGALDAVTNYLAYKDSKILEKLYYR